MTFTISPHFKENDGDIKNFDFLYDAINQYQHWFRKVYEFLATAPQINPKAIPKMSSRGEGIITIFLSKLPKTFADNIRSSVTRTSEFAQLNDFLDIFNAKLQELYENSQRSKQVVDGVDSSSTVQVSSRRDAAVHQSRDVNVLSHDVQDDYIGDFDDRCRNIMSLDPHIVPPEKKVYGCLNMAAFGVCTSQYCKKLHTEHEVAAAARYWLKVFENSKYNAASLYD